MATEIEMRAEATSSSSAGSTPTGSHMEAPNLKLVVGASLLSAFIGVTAGVAIGYGIFFFSHEMSVDRGVTVGEHRHDDVAGHHHDVVGAGFNKPGMLYSDQYMEERRMYADTLATSLSRFVHAFDSSDIEIRNKLVRPLGDVWQATNSVGNASYCSILEWCNGSVHGRLGQCDMTYMQKRLLHELLLTALSPGGYQQVMAVMNKQRVIGELEELAKGSQEAVSRIVSSLANSSVLLKGSNATWWHAGEEAGVDMSKYTYAAIAGGQKEGPAIDWIWEKLPGYDVRLEQFCTYGVTVFLNDLSSMKEFGIRFEGHHVSVNILIRRDEKGHVVVDSTPLFLGAASSVNLPVSLFNTTAPQSLGGPSCDASWASYVLQSKWVEAQLQTWSVVKHMRAFWQTLPRNFIAAHHASDGTKSQVPPFFHGLPFYTHTLIPQYSNRTALSMGTFPIDSLTPTAKWHLSNAFDFYISTMANEIASMYSARVIANLYHNTTGKRLKLIWAGEGLLSDPAADFYSCVQIGQLVHQVWQTQEWSVQTPASQTVDPKANHVHSALVDLNAPGVFDPIVQHLDEDGGDHGHHHHIR